MYIMGWNGLKVGEPVAYNGMVGTVSELITDRERCVFRANDGREYVVKCNECRLVDGKTYCPFCWAEGVRAEVFENKTLKRCMDCSTDFKFVPPANAKPQEPVRGLRAIIG